jgi:hypothetical protein
MATSSRDPNHVRPERTADRTLSRYDLLLVVIPVVFVVALALAQVSTLAASTALGAASLVGAVAVADGLFVNPPR